VNTDPRISIEFEFVDYLSVKDLWPDGDQPEVVDANAVVELIDKCGGILRVIRDWGLCRSCDVYVRGENPNWHGDDVLFPELGRPERFIVTKAVAS
jgi:hypothetical protein